MATSNQGTSGQGTSGQGSSAHSLAANVRGYNRNHRFPQQSYDLVKEMFIALGIIGALVLVLAAVFSTPDVPALSAKQVVKQNPKLLVQTALQDLTKTDAISTYGPPYSHTKGAAQKLGFLSPQRWVGVTLPVNSEQTNVIQPLEKITNVDPALKASLAQWNSATPSQQAAWVKHVQSGLKHGSVNSNKLVLPAASAGYGPVPKLMDAYLGLGNSGLLEAAIDGESGPMPLINRMDSLLLLQDVPDANYADKLNMTGDEWGVIKETGNYPGAVWLWYYTLLYQVPPFSSSDSADLWVVLATFLVTLILMLIPFIPGLRSIPRGLKIYRLIWRDYYRDLRRRNGHSDPNNSAGKGTKI
ncbi:hypothetical protein [Alicyclobacillus sp. SO9]|uniref:hypothetical protein n=1 Tax=Alicyclobacillus sp. SO9 TaxID=2665646 RepID=UPI0018E7AD23|nr:hypothetical protein [Alicyclobacillus sp. SO9]QQE78747.1 hypothetical protein GI364_23345 [Alicyclobacillus sp. SO9]